MGHARNILHFTNGESSGEVQRRCDEWATHNCDQEEHGYQPYSVCIHDSARGRIFANETEVDEWLDEHCRPWEGVMARYYYLPSRTNPANESKLMDKLQIARKKLATLNEPHYKGVKSALITCPKCGSRLATAYCGQTWHNNCPICREELRPATKMEQVAKTKKNINEMESELKQLRINNDKKARAKAKVAVAVIVDVHC